MQGPPGRDGIRQFVPERAGQIGHGDAHAVAIGGGVVKPFGRGEIEAEAAGVTDRQAGAAQILAHGRCRAPRAGLVERRVTVEGHVEPVREIELRGEAAQRPRELAPRAAAVAQDGGDSSIGQIPVGRHADIGRKMRRQRRAAEQPDGVARFSGQCLKRDATGRDGRPIDKHHRAQPAIFRAERIQLGVAAQHRDRHVAAPRPGEHAADASRTIGKAGGVEDQEIDRRACAAKHGLEARRRRAGIEQQQPRRGRSPRQSVGEVVWERRRAQMPRMRVDQLLGLSIGARQHHQVGLAEHRPRRQQQRRDRRHAGNRVDGGFRALLLRIE